MQKGPLVQMLDRQRVQQAAADAAKKLVDATLFVFVHATGKAHRTQVREWMGGWSDQGL